MKTFALNTTKSLIKNTLSNLTKKSLLSLNKFNSNLSMKQFSTVYVNHRDTEDNNEQAPFDFTEENYKKVEEILVSKLSYNIVF